MNRSAQVVIIVLFMTGSVPGLKGSQSDEAEAHANRGVALLEQFRFRDAAEAFEAFTRLMPEEASGHINLGIAYFNERDFDRARASFERAFELAPDDAYVHYNLGLVHKLQGDTELAVEAFERVARIDPLDSMTHYYLGTLYAARRRLEDAEASFRRTIELQPTNESAHFSLGNVLIRQGRRDEGRAELMTFQELKRTFPGEGASAGLQYTELGKYAEAVERASQLLQPLFRERTPETENEPEPELELENSTSISFVEATEESGLGLPALEPLQALPDRIDASAYDLLWIREVVLPPLGSGLAFRDVNGDDTPDLLFVRDGAPIVFANRGGRFENLVAADTGLPAEGNFIGVVIGDVDNDLDGDVYLTGAGPNALYLNDGAGHFTESSDETVRGDDISVSASFADFDHDGDLDLYVANFLDREAPAGKSVLELPDDLPGSTNRLYRNNGDGSFTDVADDTGTGGGSARSLGAMFSDLDDDRDIDFVVINDGEPARVFSNDRVGTFSDQTRAFGLETGLRMRGIDSADFDRDGSFDVFLTATGTALNSLMRGPAAAGFHPDVLSPGLLAAGVPGARYGASFLDADNDTDLDLLLVVNEPDAPNVIAAYYENTPSGFVRAEALVATVSGEGRALALADVDADGDLDAVVATNRGELVYFRNDGGSERGYVAVRAQGLRSNFDGLGAKVELKAGAASTRREVRSSSGYFSQNDLPLHFGLGDNAGADYVRFLWPGGVKQIEMDVEGGRTARIEELNRKGTSCPILYAWDGEKIRFVTDFLGGSAYGYLHAPGTYNYPDTDETVKIEAFPLAAKNGLFEMRWVNQLEEIIIYDQAALLVVDHPVDVEVFPNERLMPGPPYPERELYVVQGSRPPVRARDHRGVDVTELVRTRDRRYPDAFELLSFKGYAETHSLTMDLGAIEEGEDYVLLLYGWVDYADSSSNLAASQAGVELKTPYLEVGDASGRFEMGLTQMGFPAGLPKTMLVDLSGLVSPDKNRVRITTSMRLYWDQVLIARRVSDDNVRVTELTPREAELRFVGYPQPENLDGRQPSLYTYDTIAKTDLWGAHEGYYTRYGDVRRLVETVDDRYVITHHGDELRLTFEEASLPPLGVGRRRSFMAVADGFGKDMDLSSARPHLVDPLPFHEMTAYPYPDDEVFPASTMHRRYNTRYVGTDPTRGAASNENGNQNQ